MFFSIPVWVQYLMQNVITPKTELAFFLYVALPWLITNKEKMICLIAIWHRAGRLITLSKSSQPVDHIIKASQPVDHRNNKQSQPVDHQSQPVDHRTKRCSVL